jgi:LEA14-like dessication related protein
LSLKDKSMQAWRIGTIGALVMGLAACSSASLMQAAVWEKPQFSYLDTQLQEVSAQKIRLLLRFNAKNNNIVGIKNAWASYEVSLDGHKISQGSDMAVSLLPHGDSVIQVPADIVYQDAAQALAQVLKHVAQGDKTLPLDVHVTLYGKPTVYNGLAEGTLNAFNYSTDKRIDVPLHSLGKLRGR